jgi:uncharacterized protein
MSSLKERLKRLTGKSGESPAQASTEADAFETTAAGCQAPSIDAELTDIQVSPTLPVDGSPYSEEPLDGEWSSLGAVLVHSPAGSFIRRRKVYGRSHLHGRYLLSDLYGCAEALSAYHPGKEAGPVQAEKLLFFDTETTGLGLGAGNVPFMVGLGYWDEEGFAVEQMFIRNPAEELAMLDYIRQLMERYPYLVSYNGKSFDWPLLLSRFVMNRMKDGIPEPKHLDFLYSSRSLWKNTLPSCRLGKVEETQLGFGRLDDVPGSMAPTLYFLYLAEKRPSAIAPVFHHNELDIVSLAGLAVLFAQALEGRTDMAGKLPEEQYRLGLWLYKMDKPELSRRIMDSLHQSIQAEAYEREQYQHLLVPLAAYYKQLGAWEEAVGMWEQAISLSRQSGSPTGPSLVPYIELAMYLEHRVKHYEEGLLYAEEALQWAEKREAALRAVIRRKRGRKEGRAGQEWGVEILEAARTSPRDSGSDAVTELTKRVQRLRSKLSKAIEQAEKPQKKRTGSLTKSIDGHETGINLPGRQSGRRSRVRSASVDEPDVMTLF